MKKFIVGTMFLAFVLVLAACGGGDDTSGESKSSGESSSSANTVELVASNWEFEKDSYTVPAGEVKVDLVNKDGFHGITIEGTDVAIEGDGSATATLEAGEYTIRCTVPCGEGHTDMTTKLIVE